MSNIDSPMSSETLMVDIDSQPSMSNMDSPMSSDSMEHECEASMLDMDSQPSMEHTSPIHTDDPPHKRRRVGVRALFVGMLVIKFVSKLMLRVSRKWIKQLGLRRPKSIERSFASHPKAQFWNYRLNHWIPPDLVAIRSGKKFWFRCGDCEHDIQIRPLNVAHPTNPTWCIYCSTTHCRLCDNAECAHCFNRSFASTPFQSWAVWHPDNSRSPRDFAKRSSNVKKRFLCITCGDDHPEGFVDSLAHITNGRRCPFCSNHQLCGRSNCATCLPKTIKGNKRLLTWYDSESNPPSHTISVQSNRVMSWICEKGHQWNAIPSNLFHGRGCPECKHKSEQKCREFLRSVFGKSDVKSGRVDWCVNPNTGRKLPFDMIIKSKRTCVETDGKQHIEPVPFLNKTMTFEQIWARDRYKERMAIANGNSVVRVRVSDIYNDENDWKQRVLDAIERIDVSNPCVIKLY